MTFFDLYTQLILEFSEPVVKKLVQKFHSDASEEEVRQELEDFEKYKNGIEKKDPFQYKTWIELTEVIHAAKDKANYKRGGNKVEVIDSDSLSEAIVDDENITIYKGDSQNKCVKYGKGYSFCIARPSGGNMFSNYRLGKDSTFYFIFFKKKPKTEKDHIMVLDHTKNGYEWTFTNNNTQAVDGGWDEIISKYPELSRYESLLTNKKLDDNERVFLNKIRTFSRKPTLEIFSGLTYSEKSQALKSVVRLNDEIWNTLDKTLRNEFLSVGPNLTDHQVDNLSSSEITRYKQTRVVAKPQLIENDLYKKNKLDLSDLERIAWEHHLKNGMGVFFIDSRLADQKLRVRFGEDVHRYEFYDNGALTKYRYSSAYFDSEVYEIMYDKRGRRVMEADEDDTRVFEYYPNSDQIAAVYENDKLVAEYYSDGTPVRNIEYESFDDFYSKYFKSLL